MQKKFKKTLLIVPALFSLFLFMNCDPNNILNEDKPVPDGNKAATILIPIVTIRPIFSPNLQPVNFSSPASALPGGTVGSGMSLDVINNGLGTANNSLGYIFIGFYISSDNILNSGDVLLVGGRESVTLPLAAGATVPVSIYAGMYIPAGTVPGNYYLLAVVDEMNTVAESNENDNVAARRITILDPNPNLRPVNFVSPASAIPGGVVGSGMSLNVNNNGYGAANNSLGYIFIGFYISSDNILNSGDVLLVGGRESVTLPLAGGATVPVGIYAGMYVPAGTAPGNYYLLAVVDETKTVAEGNENDNVAANPITIN